MRNVYWFLIDGLSPEFLDYCEGKEPQNFIEEILAKGTTFTNMCCTAGGTHCSMHSIFTSLLPSINGCTGWYRDAMRGFEKGIYTLTDFFKEKGYSTFRYCDAEYERTVPMSGFDVWESSGYDITNCLNETNMMKCPRRDQFIAEVNDCENQKFVYHHIELLHELNGIMGRVWKKEGVKMNVKTVAEEFYNLYKEYLITKDDVIIISSDHGVITDIDFLEDGIVNGERQYEQSVRSLFSIVGEDIPKQIVEARLSTLDEAPTIAAMVLSINMPGQGKSLYKEIKEKYGWIDEIVYREKGTYCSEPEKRNPYTSDCFYVRDGKWKYVYGTNDDRCEWLMNLECNKDYEKNLIYEYPDIRNKYFSILNEKMIHPKYTWEDVYKQARFTQKKSIVKPFFSVVIEGIITGKVKGNIEDLAGPYYEVIEKGVTNVEQKIRGEYVVVLEDTIYYSEYLLSDLYRDICKRKMRIGERYCFEAGFCEHREDYLLNRETLCIDVNIRFKSTFKYDA